MPAVKEYYVFITRGVRSSKLGTFAWLCLASIALETLVVVKLGDDGVFSAPAPRHVRLAWSAGLTTLVVAWVAWALRTRQRQRAEKATR